MKRLRPVLAIAAVVVLALTVWALIARDDGARVLTGYIEGERVYLAAPVSGAVAELYVREGERVEYELTRGKNGKSSAENLKRAD